MKFIAITICASCLLNVNVAMAEDTELGVKINGIVQIEAQFKQDYAGGNTSDIVADEIGLGIEAQVHKFVKAQIAFLYEEGATDLEIDEAFITIGGADLPLYLAVGQLYVPFGYFESHMISDSLTLELGETREKAAQLGFETNGFYGSVYVFNGTTQETGEEDQIDHYGSNFGFVREAEDFSFDVGVGYINDIGDTGSLSDAIGGEGDWPAKYEFVDGLATYISLNIGSIRLIGEYVTAKKQFDVEHFAFNGAGAEPKAWNAEFGYSFNIAGKETTLAIGYQGTEEAIAMELPETRYLAGLSVGIYDNTTFSVEYAFDEDYDVNDGGTGEDANSVIMQLAVEF